jgi:hypothetical protein
MVFEDLKSLFHVYLAGVPSEEERGEGEERRAGGVSLAPQLQQQRRQRTITACFETKQILTRSWKGRDCKHKCFHEREIGEGERESMDCNAMSRGAVVSLYIQIITHILYYLSWFQPSYTSLRVKMA